MRFALSVTIVVALSSLLVACGGKRAVSDPVTSDATPSASLTIRAKGLKFDKNVLATTAGTEVTVTMDNQDAGALHNVAVYTDAGAKEKVYAGDLVSGRKTVDYHFQAPPTPGTYYFRCDAHPDMKGAFLVR